MIGCIVACFPAVLVGPLHYRSLEHAKDEALKVSRGNFDVMMEISADMKVELAWWAANIRSQSKLILETTPEVTITSDASMDGWGGAYMDRKVGGRWDEREQTNHINYLELLGAFFVLKSFRKYIEGKHVVCYWITLQQLHISAIWVAKNPS